LLRADFTTTKQAVRWSMTKFPLLEPHLQHGRSVNSFIGG
jgi:hypothetical protein